MPISNPADIAAHTAISGAHHTRAQEWLSGAEGELPVVAEIVAGMKYLCTDKNYYYEQVTGAWVKKFSTAWYKVINATLAHYQTNPATGTFGTQSPYINDGNTGNKAGSSVIGQYSQVVFPYLVKINQWRQFGWTDNNGSGEWKIEYQDVDGNWHDWVTGIPTRATADWTGLSVEAEVTAQAMRLVVVTVDTGDPKSWIGELEVYHN